MFKVEDIVTAFNSIEWSKTGDLPEGNDVYYQKAKILKLRYVKNEQVADLEFESGLISHGHFVRVLEDINNLN